MSQLAVNLWHDERGFILSAELVIIATVVVLGLVVGFVCLRDAIVHEYKDLANAFCSLDQSYMYRGLRARGGCGWGGQGWGGGGGGAFGYKSWTAGSFFGSGRSIGYVDSYGSGGGRVIQSGGMQVEGRAYDNSDLGCPTGCPPVEVSPTPNSIPCPPGQTTSGPCPPSGSAGVVCPPGSSSGATILDPAHVDAPTFPYPGSDRVIW